jgi:hypothetical protein
MTKTIEDIHAPKPAARPRINACSIGDAVLSPKRGVAKVEIACINSMHA